ncbi:hypothetical protein EDD86DRAFT_278110 [Gorgonomyces haynaldii]|nr:hypothetical protein EDD86DRAFT_278110 [Gorgonomyces haynaldii]
MLLQQFCEQPHPICVLLSHNITLDIYHSHLLNGWHISTSHPEIVSLLFDNPRWTKISDLHYTILNNLSWLAGQTRWRLQNQEIEITPIPDNNVIKTAWIQEGGYHPKLNLNGTKEVVVFVLSQDAFCDPFEIERIDFGSRVQVFGKPDLEAPAHTPNAKSNILVGHLNGKMEIPFHLRYQPANNHSLTEITVSCPIVLSPSTKSDPLPLAIERLISDFTDQPMKAVKACQDKTLLVPTGLVSDQPIVEFLTLLTSLLGLLCILLVLPKRKQKRE